MKRFAVLMGFFCAAAMVTGCEPQGRTAPTISATRLLSDNMVSVPAGPFIMGSENNPTGDAPAHRVHVDAFLIDVHEVSNAEYRKFWEHVRNTGNHRSCHPDEPRNIDHTPHYWYDVMWNKDDAPVVGVTWWDAYAYAAWVGKRLPTEAEWEKAARGTEGKEYPWGDEWSGESCNHGRRGKPPTDDSDGYEGVAPTKSFKNSKSPYGCMNMSGNVAEWCADWYDATYYSHANAEKNPTGPARKSTRVVRGGSYRSTPLETRCWYRQSKNPDQTDTWNGFRCAKDAR